MNAFHESEDQIRVRRAKEAIAICQTRETEARKALVEAVESTKRAREKYEEIFFAAEKREVTRLKSVYNHTTK